MFLLLLQLCTNLPLECLNFRLSFPSIQVKLMSDFAHCMNIDFIVVINIYSMSQYSHFNKSSRSQVHFPGIFFTINRSVEQLLIYLNSSTSASLFPSFATIQPISMFLQIVRSLEKLHIYWEFRKH